MGSEGQACFRCPDGMMMHRSFWIFSHNEQDELVGACKRDVALEELRQEYRRLADRDLSINHVISDRVAVRVAITATASGSDECRASARANALARHSTELGE